MERKKTLSLLSWLLWQPFKYALYSAVLSTFFLMIAALILPSLSGPVTTTCIVSAMIISAVIILYKMPRGGMDRRNFVALNNLQIFTVSTIFLIMMLIIAKYKNIIIMRIWLMSAYSNIYLTILAFLAFIIFTYIFGIFITNAYAKYKRCREMGISGWKIICSMPFGFSLLWIPGYLLKDEDKATQPVAIHNSIYNKINNWIIAGKNRAALFFALLTIYSGFFYGFNFAILTLVYAVAFLLWFKLAGLSSFRQQQNKIYSYFAIVMNIVVLVGVIAYSTYVLQFTTPDMTVNISDVPTTQMIQ